MTVNLITKNGPVFISSAISLAKQLPGKPKGLFGLTALSYRVRKVKDKELEASDYITTQRRRKNASMLLLRPGAHSHSPGPC